MNPWGGCTLIHILAPLTVGWHITNSNKIQLKYEGLDQRIHKLSDDLPEGRMQHTTRTVMGRPPKGFGETD